jgi:glycoside/pentoside/hexuronide:cation symporter, GPH family
MSLSLRTKLVYATSNVGSEAIARSRSLWLLYYYAPPADSGLRQLLPSVVVGALLAGGAIVASLNEVVVGYISDRTSSRLGRRLPYIITGAPPAALFAFLVFTPPTDGGAATTAIYLFVALELMFLFSTLAAAPYDALLPELAHTSRERVSLQAFKVYLGVAGTVVGLVGSTLLVHQFGFRTMAVSMAAVALVCRYAGTAGIWGHARRSQPSRTSERLGFRAALRATAANTAFRSLLPSIVLFAVAFELMVGVIPFYAHAVIPQGSWLGAAVLLAVAIGAAVVCVPLFALLARRTSKSTAYRASMLFGAVSFPLLGVAGFVPWLPAEIQIVVAVALIGAPVGAHYLFPVPLTADVIDDDSSRTAERREATFLGATHFVERTATSLAPAVLVGARLLGDTRGDSLGIHLVGPVAGALLLAAWFTLRRYDVPDALAAATPPAPPRGARLGMAPWRARTPISS